MKKIGLGILLGAVLGALDGATSWFTPEVRAMLMQIIVGSVMKDAMAGAICGIFALKVRSVRAGVVFGAAVGCAFAFLVAHMQHGHYWEILVPGTLVGAALGYFTQRVGGVVAAGQ